MLVSGAFANQRQSLRISPKPIREFSSPPLQFYVSTALLSEHPLVPIIVWRQRLKNTVQASLGTFGGRFTDTNLYCPAWRTCAHQLLLASTATAAPGRQSGFDYHNGNTQTTRHVWGGARGQRSMIMESVTAPPSPQPPLVSPLRSAG